MEDYPPPFFIGHHEARRPLPVSTDIIKDAHSANYDMVTSPITTPHFQSRVLSILSSSLAEGALSSNLDITRTRNASPIVVPPLSPADTPLTPDDSISQIIGMTSAWIDLSSPDPIIADISRQILKLELTYAAFCGITYVLIRGPRMRGRTVDDSGLAQYARSILDALNQGPYMQLYIWMSMIDHSADDMEQMGDLAPFARDQFLGTEEMDSNRLDLFGTWEVWNMIRTICKYPSRLCVALSLPKLLPPAAIQSRWYSEPVRLLTLDCEIFSKNAKGYPVLSKAHQALITRFVRLRNPAWFLLCNVGAIPPSYHAGLNGSTQDLPPITSASAFPTPAEVSTGTYIKDPTPHLSYMRNLQTKQPIPTALDRFGAGYQDYLQAPLQPLTVNLESITYEVFERDPVKYDWYERAIARALHDWIEQGKPTSNPDGRVVVAVVGAGRGPLVTRALKASEDVGVEIDMWALEKNPNAFVLLQRHNEMTWSRKVNLVKSDMRTWRGPVRQANAKHISRAFNNNPEADVDMSNPQAESMHPGERQSPMGQGKTFTGSPETDTTYLLATATHQPTHYKIDILISELLGSFADNELSPECLDGVQHLLNPVHGISIPSSYTAHLTPIAAPRLHADISHTMTAANPQAAEIPYVVMFNAIDFLSTSIPDNARQSADEAPTPTPQVGTAWSFHHPNPSLPTVPLTSTFSTSEPTLSNSHNARHTTLTFPIANRSTCHGLAGYFETVLYTGVELSTNPNTMDRKSEGMISWFPIYFPLKTPLYVPDSSLLTVNMWRKTDDRQVWYEWIVDIYLSDGDSNPIPITQANIDKKGKATKEASPAPAQITSRRRIRVGGSELHSSEKEACMM